MIPALFVLGVLGALAVPAAVAGLVIWGLRRRAADERPAWSLRRLLQYGFLFAALATAGVGLTRLVAVALPIEVRIAGAAATEAALGLSLTLVATPVWLGLWRLVAARLRSDASERAATAWPLYLAGAGTLAAVVTLVGAAAVGAWVLDAGALRAQALAAALVWALVWALHAWLARHRRLAPIGPAAELIWLAGSVVGLAAAVLGLVGVLRFGFAELVDLLIGSPALTEVGATESLRRSIVVLALGAAAWWWYWLRTALSAARTPLWHGVVVLVGVLGGALAAVAAAGAAVHSVLQWLFGVPGTDVAAAHFAGLPGALAVGVVGAAVWGYHRAVLGEAARSHRGEAERAAAYLLAGLGLLAAAGGLTAGLSAGLEALGPAPLAATDPGGRNTLVTAATLLVVGGPLWALLWRRLQQAAARDPQAELAAPSRRSALFVLLGAGGLAAVAGLIAALFTLLRALLEGELGLATIAEARLGLALALTAGAVAGYHWAVHREDRAVEREEPAGDRAVEREEPAGDRAVEREEPAGDRRIVLLGADAERLRAPVAAGTGAVVDVLERTDVGAGPVEVERVLAVIHATAGERLLVIVDGDGAVTAIPYEPGDGGPGDGGPGDDELGDPG